MESVHDILKDKNNENRVVNVEGVQESNFGNTEDSHDTRSKGISENNLSK